MTILSPETLATVLDLLEAGASVVETTAAIGGSPKSKIIFKWLADSEAAGEFGVRPDPASPWCITWGERPLEFFHILYSEARATGRENRAMRVSPIRRELEERLAAKRAGRVATVAPSMAEQHAPPAKIVEHVKVAPVVEPRAMAHATHLPLAPRPSHIHKARPLDGANVEPPTEGRFSMTADRPKSKAERRAGTVEVTDAGIKQW